MKHRVDLVGTAALLGTLFCWSVVPVLLRDLTHHVDAWTANGLRYPLAAVLYWPVLLAGWKRRKLGGRLWLRALPPALLSACGQVLWALAPYYLEASVIGFLIKCAILWAAAGALILFPDERALLRSWKFYAGFLLAVVGFALLAAGEASIDAPGSGTGVLIVIACSAFFGLYGVSVRYFLTGIRPLLAFGVVAQYVSAVTLTVMLVAFAMRGGDASPGVVSSFSDLEVLSARAWWLLLGSSFLGIALSHVFFYTAIQRLGPTIATSSHLSTPFLTLALAFALLGETMTAPQWIAGIVMVGGGALLILSQESIAERRRRLQAS